MSTRRSIKSTISQASTSTDRSNTQSFQEKKSQLVRHHNGKRDRNPWPPHSHTDPTSAFLPSRHLSVVIHVVLFAMFGGSFLYNIAWDISHHRIIITDWIYLTHWNLTFQVIFCTYELLSDFSHSFAERTAPFRAKLFHTIVSPFCLFVFCFFWGLCFIDEELVRPKNPDERSEDWYNHMVHTMILPAAILESMANYHLPPPLIESYTITVLSGFIYTCWSLMWGNLFDMWSYELFRVLSVEGFVMLLFFASIILCSFSSLARYVHRRLWLLN